MKILFTFGGLPHYYNRVLNRLNKIEGLEIVVVAPLKKGSTIGKGVYQKIEGIEFKLIQLEEYKTFYGKPFFKDFNRVLKEENPDAVVTIWPYILAFVFKPSLHLGVETGKINLILKDIPFGVPKLNNCISYYLNSNLSTESEEFKLSGHKFINVLKFGALALLRIIYYNFCKAHVNYIDEAFDILGSYGVNKKKIFITYNSPDTDILLKAKEEVERSESIFPDNKYRIIHVGRLVTWKRVDMLIRVISKLKNKYPDIELIIVGDGPQMNELINLSASLNISDKVKFIGGVYDNALLGKYFKASSIYILAGMGGLSINEAMCFDKPVICSVCDGTEKKLVREGYNGLYFSNGDENDLTNKIDYLFSNPELLNTMGKNSGKIIREEVNIHTVIDGYIRAFNYVSKNKFGLKYIHNK